MELLADWPFWVGVMLVALILEFAISGVGMLAAVAGAAGLAAGFVVLAKLVGFSLTWPAALFVFAACLVVTILLARAYWSIKPDGNDINKY